MLRALGATPPQVRRLIAGEALLVSLVAGALGLVAGPARSPTLIVDVLADRGEVGPAFAPGATRSIPLAAALGMGVADRRSSPSPPRRAAPGASRPPTRCARSRSSIRGPGSSASCRGVACLLGGVAMSLAVLGLLGDGVRGARRDPARHGHRAARALAARDPGRAARRAAAPARRRRACSPAPGWRRTAGAPPRSRRRSCSSTMLAGIQGVVESSNQRHTEDVTRGARPRAARRRRHRRRAAARRARPATVGAARRRRRRHGGRADRGLPARRGPRRPEPVDRPPGWAARRTASTLDPDVVARVARATSAATPSPSAACSPTPATSGSATPCPVRMADTDAGHAARRRRSTTAPPGSATCCSTPPSPGATRRDPADAALFVAGGAGRRAVARALRVGAPGRRGR